MVDGIMPSPKDMYILIPRTYNYDILHGTRYLEDVIKVSILKWEDHPLLS